MTYHVLTPAALPLSPTAPLQYQLTQGQTATDSNQVVVFASSATEPRPVDWFSETDKPRLDLQYRDLKISLQENRAAVQGSESQIEAGIATVAGYITLRQALETLEAKVATFQQLLSSTVNQLDQTSDLPSLKQAIAESTEAGLILLAIKRRLELPSGIGVGSLPDKLRTELAVQSLFFDRATRLEHELEWLHEGLYDALDSKQENRRFRLESLIGLVIIAFLIIEFAYSYWND